MSAIFLVSPPPDQPDGQTHIEPHGQTDEHHGPARDQASLPGHLALLHHPGAKHHHLPLLLLLLSELSPAQLYFPPIEWPDWPVVVSHLETVASGQGSEQVELVFRDGGGVVEDSPGHHLVTAGGGQGPGVPVEHAAATRGQEALHRDSPRQLSLLAGCGETLSRLNERLQAGVVLGREAVEDTKNCQAVRVGGRLTQAGVLGVVVDQVELQGEGEATNQVLRTHLGPVAPVKVELSEDVFVLQSSPSMYNILDRTSTLNLN